MSSNIFQTVIDEQELSEGRPSQRHPLEGHEYHKKSDDQLRYIVKDAGEAAKSLKGTRSESKYLDQVNDASTVLHFRKNGMPDWYKKKYGHMKESVELDEKTLTPAELKKREEVAKAMEREKPGMPMSKKMAIATAVAKRVAEQNEDSE